MSPDSLAGRSASKRVTLYNWGAPQPFVAPIKRFQLFSTMAKRDRFIYLKRSRSIVHLMVIGDTCPQGTSNHGRQRAV